MIGLAVERHVPARLLDEAVDHREAKPAARAHLLGGEEGLEGALLHLLGHARAGVSDRDEHIPARPDLRMQSGVIRARAPCSRHVMVSSPPLGMASRALIARLRIAFCSWLGSTRTGQRSLSERLRTRIVSPRVRRSSGGHVAQQIPDIDRAWAAAAAGARRRAGAQ